MNKTRSDALSCRAREATGIASHSAMIYRKIDMFWECEGVVVANTDYCFSFQFFLFIYLSSFSSSSKVLSVFLNLFIASFPKRSWS